MSNSDLERWIGAWLDGRICDADSEALQQELRESAEARATFERFAQLDAVIREVADTESVGAISKASGSSDSITKPSTTHYARALLAIAAGIVVALTATLYFRFVNTDRNIARVTGLNGTLTWIGNGGQIVQGSEPMSSNASISFCTASAQSLFLFSLSMRRACLALPGMTTPCFSRGPAFAFLLFLDCLFALALLEFEVLIVLSMLCTLCILLARRLKDLR